MNCEALDAIAEALDAAERLFLRGRLPVVNEPIQALEPDPLLLAKRDALYALALADLGHARDTADQAQSLLENVLTSRSWRFTKLFRVIDRAIRRLNAAILSGHLNPSASEHSPLL